MSADSLITPPNPSIDSFRKSRSPGLAGSNARNDRVSPKGDAAQQGTSLMSPPVSPNFKYSSPLNDAMEVDEGGSPAQMIQDPVLFPGEEVFSPSNRGSLFSPGDLGATASRPATLRKNAALPREEPSQMFKMQMMPAYLKAPQAWRTRELAQLKEDDLRRRESRLEMERRYKATTPVAKSKAKASPKTSRPAQTSDPRPIPSIAPSRNAFERPVRNRRAPATVVIAAAAAAAASLADLAGNVDALPKLLAPELEPVRKRIVAPRSEDKDIKNFAAIPDYCPDPKSLEGHPKCLKVDWKSHPIDLTNDPHRHLLHPDEISLASNLRLDCAHYLTVKRRFFVGRLNCLKEGKQFRKTDAQKACRIDVNKASQLWTAFDRVGWLNPRWMDPFL